MNGLYLTFSASFWLVFLSISILSRKNRGGWYVEFLYLISSLYLLVPFFISNLGFTYFGIDEKTIVEVTSYGLVGYIGSYFLTTICSKKSRIFRLDTAKAKIKISNTVQSIAKTRIIIFYALIIFCGAAFWIDLLRATSWTINLVDTRGTAKEVFFANNLYIQILFLPVSVIAAMYALEQIKISSKAFFFVIVLLAWMPFLFVGARKEFAIFSIAVIFFGNINQRHFVASLATLFVAFIYLGLMRETGEYSVLDNIARSMHEFTLPQYLSYTAYERGGELNSVLENSSYIVGIFSLIPSFLRPVDYSALGVSFAKWLGEGVGIGASLQGEAILNLGFIAFFIHPILITGFVLMGLILLNKKPIFGSMYFAYLVFIGRTDFWIFVFYCFYTYILLSILLGLKLKKQN